MVPKWVDIIGWIWLTVVSIFTKSLIYIDYMIHEIEIKLTFKKNKMIII
jgi:hypothetical protein